jgi:methylmalonyl-CoA mutase C-terminal domain/subunit
MSGANKKPVKIIIGKPGLDGHDVGAKVVARAMMDAGFEVIYTGLRKSPGEIAQLALEEDADVIGLSSLAGSHIPFCRKLKSLLDQYGLKEKLWLIGGCIPDQDHKELLDIGVDGVFAGGTRLDDIVDFINANVNEKKEAS